MFNWNIVQRVDVQFVLVQIDFWTKDIIQKYMFSCRCGQGPVLIRLHPTFVSMSLPLCKYLSRARILPPLVPCTPFAKLYGSVVKILKSAKILKPPGRPNSVTAVNSARKILSNERYAEYFGRLTDHQPFLGNGFPVPRKHLDGI